MWKLFLQDKFPYSWHALISTNMLKPELDQLHQYRPIAITIAPKIFLITLQLQLLCAEKLKLQLQSYLLLNL